ncbi:hypothetical protein S83_008852, partial [Arachis hypogaea]
AFQLYDLKQTSNNGFVQLKEMVLALLHEYDLVLLNDIVESIVHKVFVPMPNDLVLFLQNEFLEGREGPSDKLEVIISERHTLHLKLLEQRIGIGKCE